MLSKLGRKSRTKTKTEANDQEEQEKVAVPENCLNDPIQRLPSNQPKRIPMTQLEKEVFGAAAKSTIAPVTWVQEGDKGWMKNWYMHRKCLAFKSSPVFQISSISVTLLNSITVGMSEASWIDATGDTVISSCFLIFYIVEFIIKFYGSTDYPCRYLELWVDAVLLGLGIMSSWIFPFLAATKLVNVRPTATVFRLFQLARFTRVFKALKKVFFISRTLRVFGDVLQHFASLLLALVVLLFCATFVCTTMVTSISTENSRFLEQILRVTSFVAGDNYWIENYLWPLYGKDFRFPRNILSNLGICVCMTIFAANIVRGLVTMEIVSSGNHDDAKCLLKSKTDSIDLEWLKKTLANVDWDGDKLISVRDLRAFMIWNPVFETRLCINMDDACVLLRGTDKLHQDVAHVDDFALVLIRHVLHPPDISFGELQKYVADMTRVCTETSLAAAEIKALCVSSKSLDPELVEAYSPQREAEGSVRALAHGSPTSAVASSLSSVGSEAMARQMNSLCTDVDNALLEIREGTKSTNEKYIELSDGIQAIDEKIDRIASYLQVGSAFVAEKDDESVEVDELGSRILSLQLCFELASLLEEIDHSVSGDVEMNLGTSPV